MEHGVVVVGLLALFASCGEAPKSGPGEGGTSTGTAPDTVSGVSSSGGAASSTVAASASGPTTTGSTTSISSSGTGDDSTSSSVGGSNGSGGDSTSDGDVSTTQGDAGSGGAAGNACDDFSCPDLGNCFVQRETGSCVRVCEASSSINTPEELSQVAALKCQVLDADISLSDDGIKDLTDLQTVTEILGSFDIENANGLATIELPALKSIGGHTQLSELDALVSIELPRLEHSAGWLYIIGNPNLETIQMDSLSDIPQLSILMNDSLLTVHGLPALYSVEANVFIADNPLLNVDEVDEVCSRVGCDHCHATDSTICY